MKYLFTSIVTTTFLLFAPLFAATAQVSNSESNSMILENFENDTAGDLPQEWYDRDGNKKLTNHTQKFTKDYHYWVMEDGNNKFLRYQGTRAKHISFPLVNKDKDNIYNINIYETPILSWKVRAHSLPKNANENDDDRNDSVASMYIFFEWGRVALFKKVPKTIRYSWSTTLQEGTETSKLFGNQQIKIVKSGKKDKGKWVTFKVNLVEDFRRMFGDDPPKTPIAILILSDGDSTGSYVKADYDDIMLKSEK